MFLSDMLLASLIVQPRYKGISPSERDLCEEVFPKKKFCLQLITVTVTACVFFLRLEL